MAENGAALGPREEIELQAPAGQRSDTPFFTWVKLPRNEWRDVRVRERFAGRGRGALPIHLILDLAMSFKHSAPFTGYSQGPAHPEGHHHVWPRSWHSLQQQEETGRKHAFSGAIACLWKEKAVLSGP